MPTAVAAAAETVNMGQVLLVFAPGKLTAVLGSCIGVAMYEPRTQAAVLAHVVLPSSEGRPLSTPGKFADTAVPHMLELLQREGIPTSNLLVRIAGGASMFGKPSGPLQVGDNNITAVLQALEKRKLQVVGQHVGGAKGRRVTLDAQSGQFIVEVVGSPPVIL